MTPLASPIHPTTGWRRAALRLALAASALPAVGSAQADAATDWNMRSGEFVVAAGLTPEAASRMLALAHTAAFEVANAITRRYPTPTPGWVLDAPANASVEAAIATAHRGTWVRLLPAQQASIDQAWRAALAAVPDGAAKDGGVAAGERAASQLLAQRADDAVSAPDTYRPYTQPGRYVPTTTPVSSQWGSRKPWLMTGPSQFRPGPPPALTSDRWARDFNEIKSVGARRSPTRTQEQTDIARFWETTQAPIYHALLRVVADGPGRDVVRNARLYAAATQAVDDAMIAVFDAKYHHGFWRPITAIRNADLDGHEATERDPQWVPFINTPMHPEYPCAHCVQAGAIGTVIEAEIGRGPVPALATRSATAEQATRRWSSVEAFMQEVANARVYGGMHYRFSSEAGLAMGRSVGALAVQRFLGD